MASSSALGPDPRFNLEIALQRLENEPPDSPEYRNAWRALAAAKGFFPTEICPACGVNVYRDARRCDLCGLGKRWLARQVDLYMSRVSDFVWPVTPLLLRERIRWEGFPAIGVNAVTVQDGLRGECRRWVEDTALSTLLLFVTALLSGIGIFLAAVVLSIRRQLGPVQVTTIENSISALLASLLVFASAVALYLGFYNQGAVSLLRRYQRIMRSIDAEQKAFTTIRHTIYYTPAWAALHDQRVRLRRALSHLANRRGGTPSSFKIELSKSQTYIDRGNVSDFYDLAMRVARDNIPREVLVYILQVALALTALLVVLFAIQPVTQLLNDRH